jgi:hypothetical protein
MTTLKVTPKTPVGAVMRSVPDFDRLLRREHQFNLLRTIGELPQARRRPWMTVCRIAGLTEIEIRLLNDLLVEAARDSERAA